LPKKGLCDQRRPLLELGNTLIFGRRLTAFLEELDAARQESSSKQSNIKKANHLELVWSKESLNQVVD
jgi:hypothetical protein